MPGQESSQVRRAQSAWSYEGMDTRRIPRLRGELAARGSIVAIRLGLSVLAGL